MADRSPKEKVQVEPSISPKLKEFTEWLIGSFYGPSDYPEKIEIRVIHGPRLASLGPLIKQVIYPPSLVDESREEKTETNGKSEKRKAKPNREELVALANEISMRCQNHCDGVGKATAYGVHLIHFMRSDEPYERWVLKKTPLVAKSRGEMELEGLEDEDGTPMRTETQRLGHHERMFSMMGGILESLIDRQDRIIERQEQAIAQRDQRYESMMEVVERARTLEHERLKDRRNHDLRVRAVEKGMNLLEGLAPNFLAMLSGNKAGGNGAIVETPQSMTLKLFFKHEKDGGQMTDKQLDAAFGMYDDSPEMKLIQPGVLSLEQGKILHDVASLRVPASELEKLLPGEQRGLTQEQLVRLQQIFGDQLIPVMAMVGTVMQQREAKQQQPTQ